MYRRGPQLTQLGQWCCAEVDSGKVAWQFSIIMLIYRPQLYAHFIVQKDKTDKTSERADSEYSASFNFIAKLREMFLLLYIKYVFYLTFNPILLDTISDNSTTPEYWTWTTFSVEATLSTVNLPILLHFNLLFWETYPLPFFLVLGSELCAQGFSRKSKNDLFLLKKELWLIMLKRKILFLCLLS